MNDIKAIRTRYNGILFRSKLEAQWAKFFDSLNIPWIYEPEGFVFSDNTMYMPDFYLPDSEQWFEVKGIMNDADSHKINMLCKEGVHDVVIGYANGEFEMYDTELCWIDKGLTFLNQCTQCGKYSFMNSIGSWHCRCCNAYDGDHYVNLIAYGDGSDSNLGKIGRSEWNKRATIDIRRGGY